MTRICPKCSYVRQPSDDAPEWQCPSCQIAYIKAGGEPVPENYGRYGAPVIRERKAQPGFSWFKWILIALLVVMCIGVFRPVLQDKKAMLMAEPVSQPAVTLYSTKWCGYCTAARTFFDKHGIDYTELDIETTTAGYEGHKKLGGRGVPLLVIGDDVIHGYSEGSLRHALQPWMTTAASGPR